MTSPAEEVDEALAAAHSHAERYLASLPTRPVVPEAGVPEVIRSLGPELPEDPVPAADVIDRLAEATGPGIAAVGSGRFFG